MIFFGSFGTFLTNENHDENRLILIILLKPLGNFSRPNPDFRVALALLMACPGGMRTNRAADPSFLRELLLEADSLDVRIERKRIDGMHALVDKKEGTVELAHNYKYDIHIPSEGLHFSMPAMLDIVKAIQENELIQIEGSTPIIMYQFDGGIRPPKKKTMKRILKLVAACSMRDFDPVLICISLMCFKDNCRGHEEKKELIELVNLGVQTLLLGSSTVT